MIKVSDLMEKVSAYDQAMDDWIQEASLAEDVYTSQILDVGSPSATNVRPEFTNASSVFNILHHNTSILQAHTFTKVPKARITSRIPGNKNMSVAAQVLEKALDTTMAQDFDIYENLEKAVIDMFIAGRGTVWTSYEPDEKEICNEYVYWKDFGHTHWAKSWDSVSEVWRKIELSAEDMVEYFGLSKDVLGEESYTVIEFFDKSTDKVYFICEDFDGVLLEADNPTGIPGMLPCVMPLYAGLKPNTLEPIVPFSLYSEQALDVAEITQRIGDLASQLKVSGAFASQFGAVVPEIFNAPNGTLVPVEVGDAAILGGSNSVKDMLMLNPIDVWAQALQAAIAARNDLLQTIAVLSGVSELQSGYATNPYENSVVSQAKLQGINTRVKPKQIAVQRFLDRIFKLSGKMLAELMPTTELVELSGLPVAKASDQQRIIEEAATGNVPISAKDAQKVNNPSLEEVSKLLKDEQGLSIIVSIDNASLVVVDREEEKQMKMASLTAMTTLLQGAAGLIQAQPEFSPLILKSLKYITSSSAYGDELSSDLDDTIAALVDKLGSRTQEGNQKSELVGQMQLEQLKFQNAMQLMQEKAKIDMAMKQFDAQVQAAHNMASSQAELQKATISAEANIKATKIAHAQKPESQEVTPPLGEMANSVPDLEDL